MNNKIISDPIKEPSGKEVLLRKFGCRKIGNIMARSHFEKGNRKEAPYKLKHPTIRGLMKLRRSLEQHERSDKITARIEVMLGIALLIFGHIGTAILFLLCAAVFKVLAITQFYNLLRINRIVESKRKMDKLFT